MQKFGNIKNYLFFFLIFIISCEKKENISTDFIEGKIVGYINCVETDTENTLFGICVISNNNDSIMSFNVPSSILNIPESEISYGVNELQNGDSVQFNFRGANDEEIIHFDCPPSIMLGPSRYPLLDFNQAVITEINRIE